MFCRCIYHEPLTRCNAEACLCVVSELVFGIQGVLINSLCLACLVHTHSCKVDSVLRYYSGYTNKGHLLSLNIVFAIEC